MSGAIDLSLNPIGESQITPQLKQQLQSLCLIHGLRR